MKKNKKTKQKQNKNSQTKLIADSVEIFNGLCKEVLQETTKIKRVYA